MLVGAGTNALHRLGDDVFDGHDLVIGRLVDLDAGQLEQVVDGAPDAQRLGEDPLRQAADDLGVVLAEQRLGEQARARRPASSARG